MTPFIASLIWIAGIIVWTIIRIPHRRRARRRAVVAHRRSRSEQLALGLCIIGLVIIPFLHLSMNLFAVADYPFVPAFGWIGAIAMPGFLVMFHLSHKHLADNWSVTLEIRQDHKLVDHGVYSRIRHPMYTSFWLWGLAQALLIPNWIAGFAGLVSVAWLYFSRISHEEDMMRAQFGTLYDDYCQKTNRLWPRWLK